MSVPERDDVAKIIKGLKLDRAFFQDKIRYDPIREEVGHKLRKSRGKNKLDEKRRDFDIYLGEAVLPLCAQALDALCRYITRQEERGRLDPRVKARFNPCTWLAQYLLRSHPKFLTTPRRAGIYSGFSTWADSERGRRDLLRRREDFERLFNGFAKKKRVSEDTLPLIFQAADEMLYLQGEFSSHPALSADLRGKVDTSGSGSCDFGSFWAWFTGLCMANDLIKYSTIERGEQLKAEEFRYLQEREKQQHERAIEKQRQADEIAQFLEEYQHVREECLANTELNRILHENQTLTGDLPPNGDPCYEDEIVPSGDHVLLLRRLVSLLGFPKKEELSQEPSTESNGRSPGENVSGGTEDGAQARKSSKDPAEPVQKADPNLFWADDVADDWKIFQETIGTEMQDGVVDGQSLEAALPAPRAFLQLKRRVEDELERRRFEAHLDEERRRGEQNPDELVEEPSMGMLSAVDFAVTSRRSVDVMAMQAFDGVQPSPRPVEPTKPSFEALCRQHRMTMARMHWLHAQFVEFLPPVDGVKQRCGYPENPAALTKHDVQNLMAEVKPDMTLAEFEQKFIQIDTDGSGELEFDEFVQWLGEDELELDAEADKTKPSKEDLANRFKVSLDRIETLHEAFCVYLPEGVIDGYPADPQALSKECIQKLVQKFAPDISDDEFDEQFRLIDMDNSESIEFDEFLEFLDFEEIQGSEPLSPTSPP
jgi:Ca2+-binding EF-hand superfamily protein